MAESKHYTGGCHCGAVKYEVEMALEGAMECNCSICSKKGSLLAFAAPENFKVIKGDDAQNDYQFYQKRIHHLFCKNCGIFSFAHANTPRGPGVAINVRSLDNIDLSTLPITQFDGKSL